jgi:hypothetical protein
LALDIGALGCEAMLDVVTAVLDWLGIAVFATTGALIFNSKLKP